VNIIFTGSENDEWILNIAKEKNELHIMTLVFKLR